MGKSGDKANQVAIGIGIVGFLAGLILLFIGSDTPVGYFSLLNGIALAGVGYFNLKKK